MAVANNTGAFEPNKRIKLFEESLESIMHVFTGKGDLLLMRHLPDKAFLSFYQQNNLLLPDFQLITDKTMPKPDCGNLLPWGWSPVVHRLLKPYKKGALNGEQPFVKEWKTEYRDWYSREFALKILSNILMQNSELPLVPATTIPVKCATVEEVALLLTRYGKGVVKAPWSSSGRGVQMLRRSEVTPNFREWLTGVLQQQGFVMFEQMLDVEQNVGLQFYIADGEVYFLGYSFFYVSKNGQYKGNYINQNVNQLPQTASQIFKEGIYDKLVELVKSVLQKSDLAKTYEGVLGVDTLLINHNDELLIQPCLEINLRHTMGHVALALEHKVASGKTGKFEIWFDKNLSFDDFVKKQSAKFPLKFNDGKITSGFLPLSSDWSSSIGAFLLV